MHLVSGRRARTNRADLGRYVIPMIVPVDSGIEVWRKTRDRHYTIHAERDRALALMSGAAVLATEHDDE